MYKSIFTTLSRIALPALTLVLSQISLAQVPVVEAGVSRNQPTVAQNTPAPQPQAPAANNGIMLQMYEQMEQMKRELSDLRGLVEQQTYQIRQMQNEQRDRYLDLDRRVSELTTAGLAGGGPALQPGMTPGQAPVAGSALPGTQQPVIPVPSQTTPAAGSTGLSGAGNPVQAEALPAVNPARINSAPPQSGGLTTQPLPGAAAAGAETQVAMTASPENEQDMYRNALNQLLEESRYEEAIAGFDNYIQSYPAGRYMANALYWQGEALILVRRYPQAERAFRRVIDEFPLDAKAADALLKLGVVYNQTGNTGRARQTWESIRELYPESLAAIRAADDYLSRL